MYNVHEKKLDVLLLEGTRLVDMLSHSSRVSSSDVKQFGNALLEVQTEVRRQLSPETIEHLFANKGVMR